MKRLIFLALVLRIVLVFISNSHPDIGNHVDWGARLWQYGPHSFYDQTTWSVSQPNQPFGSIYLFAGIKVIYDYLMNFFLYLNYRIPAFPSFLIPVFESQLHIWLLKLPFILAEVGLGWLIYRIVSDFDKKHSVLAAGLFLFNPITFYNSAVWGQTDSLINLLALSGLFYIYKRRYFLGIPLFLSAFIFKVSLIFYLPVFLLLLWHRRHDFFKILSPLLISIVVTLILALPFSLPQDPASWIFHNYATRVVSGQGHMLNGNAFNLWYFFTGSDLTRNELETFIWGLNYRQFGQIVFILVNLPVMLILLFRRLTSNRLFFSLFFVSFSAFLLLTAMHERYLYPVFPLLTLLLFTRQYSVPFWLYGLLSLIHLVNLYNLWFYPQIKIVETLLIANNFVFGKISASLLLLVGLVYLLKYIKSESK